MTPLISYITLAECLIYSQLMLKSRLKENQDDREIAVNPKV